MSRFLTRGVAAGIASLLAVSVAMSAVASDNKIALIPGGPHPYFAPWEQAAADAKKDFGIADVQYKVPAEWKLELQTELLNSLAAQGFNAFGYFPGDAVGVNSTIAELKANNIPAVALGGCAQDLQGKLALRRRRVDRILQGPEMRAFRLQPLDDRAGAQPRLRRGRRDGGTWHSASGDRPSSRCGSRPLQASCAAAPGTPRSTRWRGSLVRSSSFLLVADGPVS